MNKRKLREMICPFSSADALVPYAKTAAAQVKYLCDCQLIEKTETEKETLIIEFYDKDGILKGEKEPAATTFFQDDDYTTLKRDGKWNDASFSYGHKNITPYAMNWKWSEEGYSHGWWTAEDFATIPLLYETEIFDRFFKDWKDERDHSRWEAVDRYQQSLIDHRKTLRHQKLAAQIDSKMATVPDVPDDFEEWIRTKAMQDAQVLFYKPLKKNTAEVSCSVCGKSGIVDRRQVKLKPRYKTDCPYCGAHDMAMPVGRFPSMAAKEKYVTLLQQVDGAILWRFFWVRRYFYRKSYREVPETKIEEIVRVFRPLDNPSKDESYQMGKFCGDSNNYRWCKGDGIWRCYNSCLYAGNLPDELKGSTIQYSGIGEFARQYPDVSLRYWDIYSWIEKMPQIEWINKMGFDGIAKWISERAWELRQNLDEEGKNIFQFLKLNKENTKLLQSVHGGWEELRILQIAQKYNVRFTADGLEEFRSTFGVCEMAINPENRGASIHKLCKWARSEANREEFVKAEALKGRPASWEGTVVQKRINDLTSDWGDYAGWCKKMGLNLRDPGVSMPTNFKKVHDDTMNEYKNHKKEIENAALQKAMDEVFREAQGSDALHAKYKGLIVVVPASGADLDQEGQTLHHCVATYKERVAAGETHIFFIRKEEEPEKPYYTLEYQNGKFIQCRGSHNCSMTPEVDKFAHAICAKLAKEEGERYDNRKCG